METPQPLHSKIWGHGPPNTPRIVAYGMVEVKGDY